MSDEALYSVHSLSKSFGDKTVLDELTFSIGRGECLVVLGRSGTGKSVLLRQLNGLERPDHGTIVFDGMEVTDVAERRLTGLRKRVSMLFQSGALFDSMDVFDNVAFPLREHLSLEPATLARRVSDKLQQVGLYDIEHKMPSELSGGMKKRVALARSLALDPEVILFDEPTTGLDPQTSATIARLIAEARANLAVTAVVVTHDLALARRVADRLAFLHGGNFRFLGTWSQANSSPDPYLTRFLAGEEEDEHVS